MTLQWLLSDWNLAFALPLVLALVYLGLYVVSGVTFGDPGGAGGGGDAGGDAAGDGDAGPDWDVDGDAHADTDSHGHGHAASDLAHGGGGGEHAAARDDGPAAHAGGSLMAALSYFGVGRVPLSLLLSGAALGWGVFGLAGAVAVRDQAVTDIGGPVPLVSLAAGLVGAAVCSRFITVLLTRFLPAQETYAVRRHGLLGSTGQAIYDVDAAFGMVGVRDREGALHQVGCRAAGDGGTIPKGSTVRLVSYDGRTKLYGVVPADVGATAPAGAA